MRSAIFILLLLFCLYVPQQHVSAAEARLLSDGNGPISEIPTKSKVTIEDSGLSDAEEKCSESKTCQRADFGNVTFAINPSRGPFPAGCRWRELQGSWGDDTVYEYWDAAAGAWSDQQPAACTPKLEDIPEDYQWAKAGMLVGPSAVTSIQNKNTHFIIKNLWYNNGRWYSLVQGSKFVKSIKISRNQQLHTLHVKNITEWLDNTNHKIVRGDTLFFDYIYFVHPTAIGHWCEMMFPLFSVLKESQFKAPDVNMVLLHLKRKHLMEWVRSVMATTLNVQPGDSLPPIWMQDEAISSFNQMMQPLEGVPPDVWVNFEKAMVLKDVFTGGKRSFQSQAHAREFRAQLYQNHGLRVPPSVRSGNTPPKVITFQRKRANRRIVNEEEFIKLLQTYAPVNVVEFNSSHSFSEQLRTVSQTGLFISAHTSNLANSIFLPPGSAVVELIQRFWFWKKLDQSFKDQTDRMGDIHHFAWRAFHANQTVYLRERDLEKFGNWTTEQCHLEECVEAHTHVDILVDLDELKQMLDARLPQVFAGASVSSLASVWPDTKPDGPQPWRIPPGTTKQ